MLARIIDIDGGPRVRAKSRRPAISPTSTFTAPAAVHESYDHLIADMPMAFDRSGSTAWFEGATPGALSLSCPKHSWLAVSSEYLRGVVDEHTRTGRLVPVPITPERDRPPNAMGTRRPCRR